MTWLTVNFTLHIIRVDMIPVESGNVYSTFSASFFGYFFFLIKQLLFSQMYSVFNYVCYKTVRCRYRFPKLIGR